MATPQEIEDLLPRARKGDRDAWGELAACFKGPLEAHIRMRVGRHLTQDVDLDDVLQETLAQATQSLSNCHAATTASFLAWLKSIVSFR